MKKEGSIDGYDNGSDLDDFVISDDEDKKMPKRGKGSQSRNVSA